MSNDIDLLQVKAWAASLPLNELLNNVLTFSIHPDEVELLHDMVTKLHVPLPTPIHPRAMGFCSESSEQKYSDGRNNVKRVLHDRKYRPRMFLWQPRRQHRKIAFDVEARKCTSDAGDRWSMGCTAQQVQADDAIVNAMHISCEDVTTSSSTEIFLQWNINRNSKHSASTAEILDTIRVASRGNFLNPTFHRKKYGGAQQIPFVSPWLNVTIHYFSLAKYLASRCEVAIIAAARDKLRSVSIQRPSWLTLQHELSQSDLENVLCKATAEFVKEKIRVDSLKIPKRLRDTHLWKLLIDEYECCCANVKFYSHMKHDTNLDTVRSCPLVSWESSRYNLQQHICKFLQEYATKINEQKLLASLYSVEQPASTESMTQQSAAKSKKKKSKKRSKKKPQTTEVQVLQTNKDDTATQKASDNTAVSSAGDKPPLYDFPRNNVVPRDRNKNIVTAMSIYDDILDNVFVKVGLVCFGEPEKSGVAGKLEDAAFHSVTPTSDEVTQNAVNTTQDVNEQREKPETEPVNESASISTPVEVPEAVYVAPVNVSDSSDNSGKAHPLHNYQATFLPHARSFDLFNAHYSTSSGGFFHRSELADYTWESINADHWGRMNGFTSRDRSIMEGLFKHQDSSSNPSHSDNATMSIPASVPSSGRKSGDVPGEHVKDTPNKVENTIVSLTADSIEVVSTLSKSSDRFVPITEATELESRPTNETMGTAIAEENETEESSRYYQSKSPSPLPPSTPSPVLSPILVSLEDLKEMRDNAVASRNNSPPVVTSSRSFPSHPVPAFSLSASPQLPMISSRGTTRSASIEHKRSARDKLSPLLFSSQLNTKKSLRHLTKDDSHVVAHVPKPNLSFKDACIPNKTGNKRTNSRDDHDIRHSRVSKSHTNVNITNTATATNNRPEKASLAAPPIVNLPNNLKSKPQVTGKSEACAQSEVAVDVNDRYHHFHDSIRAHDDTEQQSESKDGSTTITSALSHRSEDLSNIKEERDTFRDMCLTLGAEVAKLNNMLAAQKSLIMYPTMNYSRASHPYPMVFDPDSVMPSFQNVPKARTLVAMSDAGHRGDFESLASDEDITGRMATSRPNVSNNTVVGSDVSTERSVYVTPHPNVTSFHTKDLYGISRLPTTHSRLSNDVINFLDSIEVQLRKQEPKRMKAIERMTKLVNTLWPRAQVKMYGSHITGLCLPSSDIDFIICLPAVHKNAPAVAPGVLEGRNAINESSQKLLARKLKSESWIDPKTMKLIDRTAIPVIKVMTRDTKAKLLKLDITFDAPAHHGLEAIHLVMNIMNELPMIRPLVLVLKQFLHDRGLLTAYTGGISSYCLFLMCARYLQEQQFSWGDYGSLLMGFLDFYGNCFDPRMTGISVKYKQYFARPNYTVARTDINRPQTWNNTLSQQMYTSTPSNQFYRRNSLSDKGNVTGLFKGAGASVNYPHSAAAQYNSVPNIGTPPEINLPYTLDPLLIEDPLSEGNNVGRNAFRIFQVQRAFSDAHRALVAALEWDIQSSSEMRESTDYYPLLKCLLQNEDVVYEI